MNSILENLNIPQKSAVEHNLGPLLIFAGAGSGKTKVITTRIAYLISEYNVSPSRILAVTFTKKASEEMLERVQLAIVQSGYRGEEKPLIGTFHSIGAMILRREAKHVGLNNNFSIFDSDDADNLIKEIMISMNIDIKQIKPQNISWLISAAKNDVVDPEDFPYKYSGYVEDIAADIYAQYQKQLKSQNAVDFGDLLFLVAKLFKENKEILEKYKAMYDYILIDEYQDTNKAQYMIIKALADTHRNLCVVGDDDQGIYGWRGADINNILSFEKDFPEVKVVKLEQNYRSKANIINAAVSVISRNGTRADKKLWTDKDDGDNITIYQAQDAEDESRFVVDEIQTLVRQGKKYSDVAVLYRTNYQSRSIEEALIRRGIGYKLVGGYRFYERKEIKDIISYLRFTHNIKDDLSLSRVINIPNRKVGPKGIATLFDTARSMDLSLGELLVATYILNNNDQAKFRNMFSEKTFDELESNRSILSKFIPIIDLFGSIFMFSMENNILAVIENILAKTNYLKWLDDGTEQAQSRVDNVEELKNVARIYTERSEDKSTALFLQDLTLIEQEQDNSKEDGKNAVTLMTMHAAKGLEFPYVFIIGVEEGIFPHSRSLADEKELEEERRLCYVGITRAKEKLWMTFCDSRMTHGGYSSQVPSRFLTEIPQELCEYYSWNG